MSSSVFIEPSVQLPEDGHTADANLVVVYGKSGVNIDPNDLERLIEEKTVQSISVIRLSSPTPSMEDAEDAKRLEEEKYLQDSAADTDELTDTEGQENKRSEVNSEGNEKSETETKGDESDVSSEDRTSEEDSSDHDANFHNKRNRNRQLKKSQSKSKLKTTQNLKQRAELVGLTFEGFYEAEAALELAKEACKMAGIPYLRNTAEHEALLLVIRNDHCYTPFTSPEQMKAKLTADKLEAEEIAAITRKVQPQLSVQAKQVILMKAKKPQTGANLPVMKTIQKKAKDCFKERLAPLHKSHQDDEVSSVNSANTFDEDEESYELIDVDSDFSTSQKSGESDNDRDSDLDFDVNNRQLKKRKVPYGQKKVRKLIYSKQTLEKRSEEQSILSNSILSSVGTLTQRPSVAMKSRLKTGYVAGAQRQVRAPQTMVVEISQSTPTSSPASAEGGIRNAFANKVFNKPAISITPKLHRPAQTSQVLTSPHCSTNSAELSKRVVKGDKVLQFPKQNVKEIVLNNVMSSPKRGIFTELSTLISAEETSQKQQETTTLKPAASIIQNVITNVSASGSSGSMTASRGFMRIDAASKNQLPSQISIETHHSSNELAAEHDKQLDLIDSIVKDELNKSLEEEFVEKPSLGINENIPKLVEMLESTEKALVSNKTASNTQTMGASNTPSEISSDHVDEIDISHGLPEDLLQHVVELIEDDKTLKEAVEKQILEEESLRSETGAGGSHVTVHQQQTTSATETAGFTNLSSMQMTQPMPLMPVTQSTTSRSIIQMSISNLNSPAPTQLSSQSLTPKSSPIIRRDPIQIVRGNGRVITLPPIEAPTTRAKRRAQVTPSSIVGQQSQSQNLADQTSSMCLNESSLDSSVHSNASFSAPPAATTMLSMTTPILGETLVTSDEKKQQQNETVAKRREPKEVKVQRKSAAAKANTKKTIQQEDAEASESQGDDDDDPDKLWCICRQPHNNRFMICCDACGDWFHGKCVNITKAMGREMEQKGREWTCPLCKKKQEDKQQRKLTDMLQVKRSNSQTDTTSPTIREHDSIKASTTDKEIKLVKKVAARPLLVLQTPPSTKKTSIHLNESQKKLQVSKSGGGQSKEKVLAATPIHTSSAGTAAQSVPQTSRSESHLPHKITQPVNQAKVVSAPTTACVICKKIARPLSVYCSDDCIRRSAQNAINIITSKTADQATTASSSVNTLDEKKKKSKGLFEELLSMPDRKPKIERITVYERKSGTKLSGPNAPTTMSIKKWLHDNPTFEIVLPGSQLSLEIEQKQHHNQRILTSQKAVDSSVRTPVTGVDKTVVRLTKTTPVTTSGHTSAGQKTTGPHTIKTPKQLVEEHKQGSQRATTPKQLQKYPQQVHIKSAKDETKHKERQQLKRQSSESSVGGSGTSSSKRKSAELSTSSSSLSPTTDSEPIRMNVRRTLKIEILQRMREETTVGENLALTSEEVEAFVKLTESEMYNYFNRDTGHKYRNKYRSLMFNIKDRKNRTLFAKICAKQIEPKQLVHMSGAELASQELAKWRENENKHQLEMIKKSELEMLSCTKNYLFKNHKGEEVLESKETDVCVNLDITTPVEDLVNILNSVATDDLRNESVTGVFENSSSKQSASPVVSVSDVMSPQAEQEHHQHSQYHHHHHHQQQTEEKVKHNSDLEKKHRSKSRDRDRQKDDTEKERDRREKRHRSRSRNRQRERHHRDKSRSRRRSRSRSKSRSRSHDRRHKSFSTQHKDDRREREKDDKDRKKIGTASSTISKASPNVVAQIHQKDKNRNSPVITKQKSQKQSGMECFNLIDQIIESSKTVEEAANLVKDGNKEKHKDKQRHFTNSPIPTSSSSLTSQEAASVAMPPSKRVTSTSDSDQEPTSTVSIPTPPHEEPSFSRTNSPTTELETATIWTGPISMNEVATLQINIQPLIGNLNNVGKLLPSESLDVVGRIDTETVWEYLWKIRKSPNKEIVLIRLMPLSDDDIDGYAKLFSYLDQKKRLGVIKSSTSQIKDIYIFPLGTGKSLPKVLQVTSQNNFYNDPYRADVIVGILVCVTGKRPHTHPTNLTNASASQVSSTAHFGSSSAAKHSRRHRTDASETFTPPGSPKRKKRLHKTDIDLDAIIKAPIVRKPAATTSSTDLGDDADEPYSPGGSSDEDLTSMYTAKAPPTVLLGLASADEDLKRKMEEINRQIAAQEIEIAGLLNAETTGTSASVLANISIPSNLPQILASINKSKETPTVAAIGTRMDANPSNRMTQQTMVATNFEEYNPEDAILTSKASPYTANTTQPVTATSSTSRLAQLSEAELLSMVPDDVLMEPAPKSSSHYNEPPPPGV